MSHYFKVLIAVALLPLTLSACKPGVYYPFGDVNAATNTQTTTQTTQKTTVKRSGKQVATNQVAAPQADAPVAKREIAGERVNMIIPG